MNLAAVRATWQTKDRAIDCLLGRIFMTDREAVGQLICGGCAAESAVRETGCT